MATKEQVEAEECFVRERRANMVDFFSRAFAKLVRELENGRKKAERANIDISETIIRLRQGGALAVAVHVKGGILDFGMSADAVNRHASEIGASIFGLPAKGVLVELLKIKIRPPTDKLLKSNTKHNR